MKDRRPLTEQPADRLDRLDRALYRFATALVWAALLWLVPAILHGLWVHR